MCFCVSIIKSLLRNTFSTNCNIWLITNPTILTFHSLCNYFPINVLFCPGKWKGKEGLMCQTVETGFKWNNTESCFCHQHGYTIDRFEQDVLSFVVQSKLWTPKSVPCNEERGCFCSGLTGLVLLHISNILSRRVHEPVLVFGNHLFLSAHFGPIKMTHPKL